MAFNRVLQRTLPLFALALVPLLAAPAWAASKDKGGKLLLMAAYTDVQASSSREGPRGERFGYDPINVTDMEPRTAWCAAERMLGVGEWLEVGLLVPTDLSAVELLGTASPPESKAPASGKSLPFNRVKRIKLTNPLGEFRILEFDDDGRPQRREIDPPLPGERFRFTIESVYPGAERALTCISEVALWGASDPGGAAVDDVARKAIETDVRHVLDESFAGTRASLAGTRLRVGIEGVFGRYQNFSPIAIVKTISEVRLSERLLAEQKEIPAHETACAVAVRALYDASPYARRLIRERYALGKELPLGEGCGRGTHPGYWALRGRREAVPLFWKQKEYYGLLELGDARALEPFLLPYKNPDAPYHWWEQPYGRHGRGELAPRELVGKAAGPYAKRVLARLIEENKDRPGYYLDGLRALYDLIAP